MSLANTQQQRTISVNDIRCFRDYSARLANILDTTDFNAVSQLCESLRECWSEQRNVFLCGNGGSAANAMHIANDLVFGAAPAPSFFVAFRTTAPGLSRCCKTDLLILNT